MKVAIVHDYLNQYGGAERVLETLLTIFPHAHLYTLLYDRARMGGRFSAHLYKTSVLDGALTRRNHRFFIPLMPLAAASLDLGNRYDLIVSASAGYAKGIRYGGHPFHLSYCYTPLRYAWEWDGYFSDPAFTVISKPIANYLKRWDYRVSQRPDVMLAISRFIADKVRAYYRREAPVVYPPVDYDLFFYDKELAVPAKKQQYYLAVGRLLHYKRFDLVVDACLINGAPLTIVGDGREERALRARAQGARNIEFVPFCSDERLRSLYHGARALLFPQEEDFGLVAAEAQACGTPVIAFNRGGALEIVQEKKTGLFFGNQSVQTLLHTLKRFERMRFDRKKISAVSKRFGKERFAKELLAHIPRRVLER